jgi:hypothetical protein
LLFAGGIILTRSFIIQRSDAVSARPDSLLTELVRETGSDSEAASIMRSLERLGSDPSILFYEMTRVVRGPRLGGAPNYAWRVRADRGRPLVTAEEVPPK